jgi:ribosomal protein S18 acetylase RimI-like enzyme
MQWGRTKTTMLTIRAFKPSDAGAVVDLWRRCGLVRPMNDPLKDIERKRRVRGDMFLVGMREATLVASVMIGYEGHRGWINYLAVAPEHRRKGFGRQIMAHAERMLIAEGCPKINLQVRASNASVHSFYASLGFARDDVVCFGKRLESDEVSP